MAGSRAAILALLVVVGVVGCAAQRTDTALTMHADRKGQPPSPHLLQQMRDIRQALRNEHPEEYEQFDVPEAQPLQRYPRLTFPALIEPSPIGGTLYWSLPIFLRLPQLTEKEGALEGTEAAPDVNEILSFYLQPRRLFNVPDPLKNRKAVLINPTKVKFYDGEEITQQHGSPLLPIVFSKEYRQRSAGYYQLHIFPKVTSLARLDCEKDRKLCEKTQQCDNQVLEDLRHGRWYRFKKFLKVHRPTPGTRDERFANCLEGIAMALRGVMVPQFFPDLTQIADRLDEQADELGEGDEEHAQKLAVLATASLISQPNIVAPVVLDSAAGEDDEFAFAATADLQYHGNMDALKGLLAKLDAMDDDCANRAGAVASLGCDCHPQGQPASDSKDTKAPEAERCTTACEARSGDSICEAVRRVKFVILAGDFADSAAGSAPLNLALNVLAVLPPKSPYNANGGNEFTDLREALIQARRPFFIVPGNHDGYVGYGGIINNFFDVLAEFVVDPIGRSLIDLKNRFSGRRTSSQWRSRINDVNRYIPVAVQWNLLNYKPRYDGLGEWQTLLGPLNLAFRYRGYSFIGLNSYDLKPKDRGAIGGAVFNWGGGVTKESANWFEETLRHFAQDQDSQGGPRQAKSEFVFMHHDPRGAVPTFPRYAERNYGIYDPTDTGASLLTFGLLGIGNSPTTGIRWPLLTPAVTYVSWSIDRSINPLGVEQEEWMREPVWFWNVAEDDNAYNARALVESITQHGCDAGDPAIEKADLVDRRKWKCSGRVSHVFFAHDNVPIPSGEAGSSSNNWADIDQTGSVFQENLEQPWTLHQWIGTNPSKCWQPLNWGACQRPFTMWLLKYRNWEPPPWAVAAKGNGLNSEVVRLDDLGDAASTSYGHGFHIVDVRKKPPGTEQIRDDEVRLYWVKL